MREAWDSYCPAPESVRRPRRRRRPRVLDWECLECNRAMTLKAAQRATRNGCPGCGGVDIDLRSM